MTDKPIAKNIIISVKDTTLISLFAVVVFTSFLGPIFDVDFPFHIKTGEYIYQHKQIPPDDPFSFYDQGLVTDRERFTLSQYWITQLLFYVMYSAFGPAGIIVLRAVIFSAFLLLILLSLKKKGLYHSLLFAIIAGFIMTAYKLDRPQYFSFFFTLVLVLLFEKYRETEGSSLTWVYIPLLMLLWANMHAGFVFGLGVVVIYASAEALKLFRPAVQFIGAPLPHRSLLKLSVIALITVLFSYVNPVGSEQILTTIESHTESKWIYSTVSEYMTPLEQMSFPFAHKGASFGFWILFGFACILLAITIYRRKSTDITVITLVFFASAASLSAVRYTPFFLAVVLPLTKNYRLLPDSILLRKIKQSYIPFLFFCLAFSAIIFYNLRVSDSHFGFKKQFVYPEEAADFLLQNRIDSKIFNDLNRGSYFIWKLYPHYKVFTDTRYINLEAVKEGTAIQYALHDKQDPFYYGFADALSALIPEELGQIELMTGQTPLRRATKPLWKKLLDDYEIDLIVHQACMDYTSTIFPLTLRMLTDDEWVLIYFDSTMQIFIRNKEKYAEIIKKHRKPKKFIYDEIIMEAYPSVRQRIPSSSPYASMAFALAMKGKASDARKMVEAALELDEKDIIANFTDAYLTLMQKKEEDQIRAKEKNKILLK